MRPHPHGRAPQLLVILVALLAIASAILLWFGTQRSGFSPRLLVGAFQAVSGHPMALLGALHYVALLLTAAVLAWLDLARRGALPATRAAWALGIVIFGALGVWAYLARRPADAWR